MHRRLDLQPCTVQAVAAMILVVQLERAARMGVRFVGIEIDPAGAARIAFVAEQRAWQHKIASNDLIIGVVGGEIRGRAAGTIRHQRQCRRRRGTADDPWPTLTDPVEIDHERTINRVDQSRRIHRNVRHDDAYVPDQCRIHLDAG